MRDLMEMAFEGAPLGLVLTEHRVIRCCNARFAAMLGYSREDLIGQSFRMLYASGDEFDRIRDIGITPLRTTGQYTDERMVLHRDGHNLWCRFRAQSLTPGDPLARLVMSFACLSDDPELRLSERERQVLALMGKGMTSKQIARELDRSPRTIEDVRARLLKRFDVRNAAELLARVSQFTPEAG